jgi:putative membrane protein
MMTRPAAVVAAHVTPPSVARTAVAAVALASWDVFLDPQMVAAHHWRWSPSELHLPGIGNVPLSNFGGWLLVALVLMTLLHRVSPRPPARDLMADAPMLALWVWTWLSYTLANLAFFGRAAVAAWGFAAMAVVGIPLLVHLRRAVPR